MQNAKTLMDDEGWQVVGNGFHADPKFLRFAKDACNRIVSTVCNHFRDSISVVFSHEHALDLVISQFQTWGCMSSLSHWRAEYVLRHFNNCDWTVCHTHRSDKCIQYSPFSVYRYVCLPGSPLSFPYSLQIAIICAIWLL